MNTVTLNEEQLRSIIQEAVVNTLEENPEMLEEWFNPFNRDERQDAKNKIKSFGSGLKSAVMNGGGVNGFKVGYNNSRADYQKGLAGESFEKYSQMTPDQINAEFKKETERLNKEIADDQKQLAALPGQQKQALAAAQSTKYTQNANAAKGKIQNAYVNTQQPATPQQPVAPPAQTQNANGNPLSFGDDYMEKNMNSNAPMGESRKRTGKVIR